jgi:hypothetical protein
MTSLAPLAATALAGWWQQAAPIATPLVQPGDLVAGDVVWLLQLGVAAAPATAARAPIGLLAGAPLAAADRPADLPVVAPIIRVSDRGWIGEPDDAAAPNLAYPARLLEPPALEYALPVLPEGARRRSFVAGEVLLANGDGALDSLAGNWAVGGQPATLLRGPHRRPYHAPLASFVTIALLRAAGAASGTTRLRLGLRDAAADLSVPLSALYAGTGGTEGAATLAGQPKPMLYGLRRAVEPVLIDAARSIYQIHAGPIAAVLAVRDRGIDFAAGGDNASYAALAAGTASPGGFITCLAEGLVRVEPASGSISLLTIDARGDASGTGYSAGTPASIARKLLTGPGGLSSAAIAADAFAAWPVGEAGLHRRGGSVAEALDALCGGLAAWWGADRLGRITGGQVEPPEALAPLWDVQPWMLRAPPEEAELPAPPRWRSVVGFRALGRVLTGEDLAGSVSATDRALWGQPHQSVAQADLDILAAYRQAEQAPELISVFDLEADATALALRLQALHGVPRRDWRVALNRCGLAIEPGQPVRLTWPRHGLAQGRVLIARSVSIRGDRTEALLWG